MSVKGLSTGEISAHLAEVYDAQVSKQTISTITDKVLEGIAEWQNDRYLGLSSEPAGQPLESRSGT